MGADSPHFLHHHHYQQQQQQQQPPAHDGATHTTSLPSVAELLSSASSPSSLTLPTNHQSGPRCDSVRQPSLDQPVSRFTPPSAPGVNNPVNSSEAPRQSFSWTPINQRGPESRSALDPLDEDRPRSSKADEHQFHQYSVSQSPSVAQSSVITSRVAQSLQGELAPSQSPINAKRQDSAVSECIGSRPSMGTHLPLNQPDIATSTFQVISGSLSQQSPNSSSRLHSTTPPSPAPSPVPNLHVGSSCPTQSATSSTRHDRDPVLLKLSSSNTQDFMSHSRPSSRKLSPTAVSDEQRIQDQLEASHQESLNPDHSTRSETASLDSSIILPRHTRLDTPNLMPPPQNSQAARPLDVVARLPSDDSISQPVNSKDPNDDPIDSMQASHTSSQPMSGSQDIHQQASLEDAEINPASIRPDFLSKRCVICDEEWEYPGISLESFKGGPSQNRNDLARGTASLQMLLRGWRQKSADDFEQWKLRHRNCVAHTDSSAEVVSGPLAADSQDSVQLNGKRKSEVPLNDGQISTKLRRVTFDSPSPKLCQTTPPPEPSVNRTQFPDGIQRHHYKASGMDVYIPSSVARILGHPEVPSRSEYPPQNDNNMWHEVKREGSSSKQSSPATGRASSQSTEEKPPELNGEQPGVREC